MKTEKMKTEKAIDFLFDQTGKLRTTRVRHEAMVNALSDISSELRALNRKLSHEESIANLLAKQAVRLHDEIRELKSKLKHEEDRTADFTHRNIELANEIEKLKKPSKISASQRISDQYIKWLKSKRKRRLSFDEYAVKDTFKSDPVTGL